MLGNFNFNDAVNNENTNKIKQNCTKNNNNNEKSARADLKPTMGYSLQMLHLALCFTMRKNETRTCQLLKEYLATYLNTREIRC